MMRCDWFPEARFGIFTRLGQYSIPGGVWHGQPPEEYNSLAKKFNPVKFDAASWSREAKSRRAPKPASTGMTFRLPERLARSSWQVAAGDFAE